MSDIPEGIYLLSIEVDQKVVKQYQVLKGQQKI